MGKLKYILLLLLLLPLSTNSQKYVNFDYRTIEQVVKNTAAIEAAEVYHNQQVDTIKKKQEKLAGLLATLASYKTLFQKTLENVSGFGVESAIYRSIVANFTNIMSHSGKATKSVMKTNFTGKAIAAFKIHELVMESTHLGNVFLSIVCNGTVKNPFNSSGMSVEKDKLNLLNRSERLNLALSIKNELERIDLSLIMIDYYCRHNSFDNLLAHIDRKTYETYVYSKVSTKRLIDRWNGLTE